MIIKQMLAHIFINFKVVGLTGLWLELTTSYLENLVMFVSAKNLANTVPKSR